MNNNITGLFYRQQQNGSSMFTTDSGVWGGFLGKEDSKVFSKIFLPKNQSSIVIRQVHKSDILLIDTVKKLNNFKNSLYTLPNEYDGILTNQPKLNILIKTADCIPILGYHQKDAWVTALHCGWRPLATGIIHNLFAHTIKLGKKDSPLAVSDWIFLIGPGISRDSYEVGEELIEIFSKLIPQKYLTKLIDQKNQHPHKYLLDLKKVSAYFLMQEGIPSENIYIDKTCTLRDTRFNSHRENGTKERNINFIGFK